MYIQVQPNKVVFWWVHVDLLGPVYMQSEESASMIGFCLATPNNRIATMAHAA